LQNIHIQNNNQQNNLLHNLSNHLKGNSKKYHLNQNFLEKKKDPKTSAIYYQNDSINREDFKNNFINNFPTSNSNIGNINKIQNHILNTSR